MFSSFKDGDEIFPSSVPLRHHVATSYFDIEIQMKNARIVGSSSAATLTNDVASSAHD